jgi:integrase
MALFRYPGSKIWWYDFKFNGQRVRESTKSPSKKIAADAERVRRRELEESFNGIKKRIRPKLFSVAADEWLEIKTLTLAPKSRLIEKTNLRHLLPTFGKLLVSDIQARDVSNYQHSRLKEGASPKTINLEIGTLRAILRRNRTWADIQQDVKMLATRDDIGHALTSEEESRLLAACLQSRSRSLHTAVSIALGTCMRYSEIRLLTWSQVDLLARTVRVGKSKTAHGTGRVIPLNERVFIAFSLWAAQFPDRKEHDFVFPSEKYGAAGEAFIACVYGTNPSIPIGDWKEAWEKAKRRANVKCRFHDLRHTGCTRMLEGGVPYPVVASIMGWSAATTIRMAKRYGHIGQVAHRQAVELLNGTLQANSIAKFQNRISVQ